MAQEEVVHEVSVTQNEIAYEVPNQEETVYYMTTDDAQIGHKGYEEVYGYTELQPANSHLAQVIYPVMQAQVSEGVMTETVGEGDIVLTESNTGQVLPQVTSVSQVGTDVVGMQKPTQTLTYEMYTPVQSEYIE